MSCCTAGASSGVGGPWSRPSEELSESDSAVYSRLRRPAVALAADWRSSEAVALSILARVSGPSATSPPSAGSSAAAVAAGGTGSLEDSGGTS